MCIKNEVYVFGGVDYEYDSITSVEKYSPHTNTWEIISDMYDDRKYFCACSFMNNVYVIGGIIANNQTNSCIEFKPKDRKWREISGMNKARSYTSCTVFEGRIIVSGGYGRFGRRNEILNTVEAFDYAADSWSYMPNMIERRGYHKSVAIKNKLFVVGGVSNRSCEVFDSTCNKFVLLKQPSQNHTHYLCLPGAVISIGTEVILLSPGLQTVLCYDVKNNVWSTNKLKVKGSIILFSCAKVPQI